MRAFQLLGSQAHYGAGKEFGEFPGEFFPFLFGDC